MATIDLPIYKKRRMALVRFERAKNGDPDRERPDIDDRGYVGDRGPVVGITAASVNIVRLVRERISDKADLWVTSTDGGAFAITDPSSGQLPKTTKMEIKLVGVAGANPKSAKLEVRYGAVDGPIIHELTVFVWRSAPIDVTPHNVTINGVGSLVNIGAVMPLAQAIWQPCGITFNVGAVRNDVHNGFAAAGFVEASHLDAAGNEQWSAELTRVLTANYDRASINIYFVSQLSVATVPGALGLGLSRTTVSGTILTNPGIVLADNTIGTARAGDTMWLANDVAHEIGHFLGLTHPENVNSPGRKDTWSRRMLMHPNNTQNAEGGWRDQAMGYGVGSDGSPRRGCLITLKDLAQMTTDGEGGRARSTITTRPGPY